MDYRTLPPEALPELRTERVQQLEAQHYRLSLRAEETTPNTHEGVEIAGQLVELERRIDVHRAALPADPPSTPDGATDDGGEGCSPSTGAPA